jgi:hypothetical protein
MNFSTKIEIGPGGFHGDQEQYDQRNRDQKSYATVSLNSSALVLTYMSSVVRHQRWADRYFWSAGSLVRCPADYRNDSGLPKLSFRCSEFFGLFIKIFQREEIIK